MLGFFFIYFQISQSHRTWLPFSSMFPSLSFSRHSSSTYWANSFSMSLPPPLPRSLLSRHHRPSTPSCPSNLRPVSSYSVPVFRPSPSVSLSAPLLLSSVALFSPVDSSDSDLELATVRHQPEGLEQLQAQTKFTRKELQSLYRGFKNVRNLLRNRVI